jgi:hypothetical protein
MKLSPPIAVTAFLVASMAVAGWLAPKPSALAQRSVHLPLEVYESLERQAAGRKAADGTKLTVASLIAQMSEGRR